MKIIWIRHGTVEGPPNQDKLTESGESFAQNLPIILSRENLDPAEIHYLSKNEEGEKIERCYNTIRDLSSKKIPCVLKAAISARKLLTDCIESKADTIVICYTTESLYLFPDIIGPTCEAIYKERDSNREERSKAARLLYKYIIVSNYDGDFIKEERLIATGDSK